MKTKMDVSDHVFLIGGIFLITFGLIMGNNFFIAFGFIYLITFNLSFSTEIKKKVR